MKTPDEQLHAILFRYMQHDPRTRASARAMIFSPEFDELCATIKLDDGTLNPDYIRRKVLERESK